MNFEIGDIVDIDSKYYTVTGVIHNSERLFVCHINNDYAEIEYPFSDVYKQWRMVEQKILEGMEDVWTPRRQIAPLITLSKLYKENQDEEIILLNYWW